MQEDREAANANSNHADHQMLACPSCDATMVRGMRFCRMCGYRLGEGVEEFVETRRLSPDDARTAQQPAAASTRPSVSAEPTAATFQPHAGWGTVAPAPATSALGRTSSHLSGGLKKFCKPRRNNWLMWLIIGVVLFPVLADLASQSDERRGGGPRMPPVAARSYVGADLDDGDNNVLVQSVMPPGSPADRAGLVGGDVIISFDGQRVTSEKELMERLAATPIGKTVEVEFLRDGQSRQTTLTTISKSEREKLQEAFERRPEGEGFLGVDPGDLERVFVEGQKVYGVRLGEVLRNRPGYIAGLRDGDIVVEFDGVPIRTPKELLARIDRAIPDSFVKITVIRSGERVEIPVRMGQD